MYLNIVLNQHSSEFYYAFIQGILKSNVLNSSMREDKKLIIGTDQDKRFQIIKYPDTKEFENFKLKLADYYLHVTRNPNSLFPRVIGMYKYDVSFSSNDYSVAFVINPLADIGITNSYECDVIKIQQVRHKKQQQKIILTLPHFSFVSQEI